MSWRRSQVVRQRSAKPRFVGSIPTGASQQDNDLADRHRLTVRATAGQTAGPRLGARVGSGVNGATSCPRAEAEISGVARIDVCGLGSGWADVLEHAGFRVARFNGAAAATMSEPGLEFANAGSAGYWAVRKRLEAGRLTWPPGPEGDKLTDDLVSTQYRPTSTGKLAMVDKAEIA